MKKDCQSGFSLIESVIAVIILVLLTVVVYSVYSFNQRAYEESEKKAELIQNGRVILERITREVRQAISIITVMPQTDQGDSNPSEIEFRDGHVPSSSITGTSAGGSTTTIFLAADSSTTTDYYKDFFLKIIGNTGEGQIRKIISYDGPTQTAIVGEDWSIVPDATSIYRLGSEYYYIRYYVSPTENEVHRQYRVYCFDSCDDCNDYFNWNDVRVQVPTNTSPCVLEDRVIGEYVSPGDLKFWGSNTINISVKLKEDSQEINLSTKVFGRNF